MLRRVTLVVLLVASLALITGYFREGAGGPLHRLQLAVDDVTAPASGAVRRVAQPFRDAGGWVSSLAGARRERDRLRAENARLRQEVAQQRLDQNEVQQLRQLLLFRRSAAFSRLQAAQGYRPVPASVLSRPPGLYASKVLIDSGSGEGVQRNDPVLAGVRAPEMKAGAALVGRVTNVAAHTAEVTLINDPSMAVAAMVLHAGDLTPAQGVLQPAVSDRSLLNMGNVQQTRRVSTGDLVVTSGYGDHEGSLRSLYPRGLPVGAVTLVSQNDTDIYKRVQVTPWVDLTSFTAVLVLTQGAGAGPTGSAVGP